MRDAVRDAPLRIKIRSGRALEMCQLELKIYSYYDVHAVTVRVIRKYPPQHPMFIGKNTAEAHECHNRPL